MGQATPFVLLDDARESGAEGPRAADTRVYRDPAQVFAAYRPADVERVLGEAEAARAAGRGELAGYVAYEAGLALEPKLAALADARSGAAGPLVWLGLFEGEPERVAPDDMPAWLAAQAEGSASLGPLDPQLSTGGYEAAFETLAGVCDYGDQPHDSRPAARRVAPGSRKRSGGPAALRK